MSEKSPAPSKESASYKFYDNNAKGYVEMQREFYSEKPDTGRRFFYDALQDKIAQMTIADIGCGAADDAVTYKEMGAQRVIGIEPSVEMLNLARETVKNKGVDIDLVAGKWQQLPLADESIDTVTARYSFHVIPDLDQAYKEVARVLRPGGMFLIAAPHPLHDAKMAAAQQLKEGELMHVPIFNGKFTVEIPPHTMEEYLSEACQNLFTVEDVLEYSMFEDPAETIPSGLLLKLRKK